MFHMLNGVRGGGGLVDFDSRITRSHHQGPTAITQHSNAQLVGFSFAGVGRKSGVGGWAGLGEEIRAGWVRGERGRHGRAP